MSGLDVFAWIVLVVLVMTALVAWVVLARLPGRIAAKRHHPHREAVAVAGWVGAISFGVFWPLALIWAFVSDDGAAPGTPRTSRESIVPEATET